MRYPLAAPDLSGNELAYVTRCLNSSWISSNGAYVQEFEDRVARLSNCEYAVATCNGTAALHLALHCLGVRPGDEVIVPSLTFVATANAVAYCGAVPVFADSEPDTWCISPASVERLIGPRTRGIVPVHLYGNVCDMDSLRTLASRHNLWLLEDCAEALGARYDGMPVGSTGEAGVFSFFGNKIVTTGEGGMIVTHDRRLANEMRLLRGQGMDLQRRYWHNLLGFNYRMTNVAAAIGLAQMERVDQLVGARACIGAWYHQGLSRVPSISLPSDTPRTERVFWMCAALLDDPDHRDLTMQLLAERGIETRPFFYPIHHFPMYRQCRTDNSCPTATELSARGLNLPTASYLKEQDVDVIIQELEHVLQRLPDSILRAA